MLRKYEVFPVMADQKGRAFATHHANAGYRSPCDNVRIRSQVEGCELRWPAPAQPGSPFFTGSLDHQTDPSEKAD
jgi:hypothetical protein